MNIYAKKICKYSIYIFVLYLVFLTTSFAAETEPGSSAFYTVMTHSKAILSSYSGKLNKVASAIFDALCLISLVLTVGRSFIEKGSDFGWEDLVWPLLRLILLIGFVYFLLNNVQLYLGDLIKEFAKYAHTVVPASAEITNPSALLDKAWEVAWNIWDKAPDFELDNPHSWFNIVVIFFCVVFVLCFFVTLAFDMLLIYLVFLFVCYGGVFFLGFMGYEHTKPMAISYLKALLANAVTYYAMLCMAGMTMNILTTLVEGFNTESVLESFAPATSMILACYVLRKLICQIPMMIGSLISQSIISFNQSNSVFGMAMSTGALLTSAGAAGMALGAGAASQKFNQAGRVIGSTLRTGAAITRRLAKEALSEMNPTMSAFFDKAKAAKDAWKGRRG